MISNLELYRTDDVPRINKNDCNKRIALLKAHKAKVYDKPDSNYTLLKIEEGIKFWSRMRDGEGDLL